MMHACIEQNRKMFQLCYNLVLFVRHRVTEKEHNNNTAYRANAKKRLCWHWMTMVSRDPRLGRYFLSLPWWLTRWRQAWGPNRSGQKFYQPPLLEDVEEFNQGWTNVEKKIVWPAPTSRLDQPLRPLPPTTSWTWPIGCPTLHDLHQITPPKKYVIPIYKKLGFPNFQSFPTSFSVFAACTKYTKDSQNL